MDKDSNKTMDRTSGKTDDDLFTVFDNMAQGVAFCKMSFDGDQPKEIGCRSVNAAFGRLTGLNSPMDQKISEILPGIRESNADLFAMFGRVVKTGLPESCETFIAALASWFSVYVYRPEAEHFIAIFDNITERKRAFQVVQQSVESLAKAEGRYHRMFNSGSDAVFVYQLGDNGLPSQFLEANDNSCLSLGYTREELLRVRVSDVIPLEASANIPSNAQKLLDDGHLTWEGAIVAKDGRRIAVEVNSSLFDLDGSAVITACVRDITARKDAETVKAKLEEELRQAQKLESVGRLAGGGTRIQ